MTQTISERLDPQVLLASLDGVEAAFADRNPRSVAMHRRARATLPGGNTRTGISVDPFPIYAESGAGAYLRDLDGHELLDLVNNASALMLGHAHPAVVEALQAQVVHGTAFSQPMAMEVEMAELLQERMPALELLRFCSSGTEAVLNALRAARAHTGRGKIAKFEGAYHGIDDQVMVSYTPPLGPELGPEATPNPVVSTSGLAPGSAESVIVLPFNDAKASVALIEEQADELAALIIDPLSTSAGLTPPAPGFLEQMRAVTEKHGILLIFDEIVSFRVHPGGVHSLYGVRPDLVTLGKVVAGGTAAAVFGGREEVMCRFDPMRPADKVWQSGTLNANPLSLSAGLVTLQHLTPEQYDELNARTERLTGALQDVFDEAGLSACICTIGSLFRIYFLDEVPRNYREAARDDASLHKWFFLSMLNRDIYWRNKGINALSAPTTDEDCDRLVEALRSLLADAA